MFQKCASVLAEDSSDFITRTSSNGLYGVLRDFTQHVSTSTEEQR